MTADYALKVSLPGKDVSSTEPRDFVFNSDNPTNLKIISQSAGTASVAGSSSTDVSTAHVLGFIPMVMLFTELTPGSGNWHFGIPLASTGDVYINADPAYTYADDTYFNFRLTNNTGSSKSVKYYYYVLGDSAS